MKKLNRYLYSLLIILISFVSSILPKQVNAQDTVINARNVNIQLTNPVGVGSGLVNWSTLASKTYVLAPLSPDYGFCISVVNNNSTSSHTFVVAAFQTGDSQAIDYTNNTGRYASLAIVGNPSPIAAGSTNTFFVRSNGAAKIAFQFSGATTQAGSPDTVDIYAVQTTAVGCGTVNPQTGQLYTLATPNTGTSATTPLMAVSDGLSQAYISNTTSFVTNPASNTVIIHVNAGSNNLKSVYFYKANVGCSAACSVIVNSTGGLGTTCTSQNAFNMNPGGPVNSAVLNNSPCGAAPSTGAGYIYFIPAGSNITVDLQGFIAPKATNNGVEVQMSAALTGTVTAQIQWYEK